MESTNSLEKFLDDQCTHPELKEALIYCIQQWRAKRRIEIFKFSHPIRVVLRDQNKIGWLSMFEGLASKQWRQVQHQYYAQKGIRKSSRKWIKGVLLKLHYFAWKQWNHRNKINNQGKSTREKEASEHLDHEITRQLVTRMKELLPADRRRLSLNLIVLLRKPKYVKVKWMTNAAAARQRYLRIKQQKADLDTISKEQSPLFKFLKTGCLRGK